MPSVNFFKVLADLSVASKQHKMPPQDSWKSPIVKGKQEREDYVRGVGMGKWGPQYPAADGIVSYFATQDPMSYHFDTANAVTKYYKSFIHTMIDAAKYAFDLWKPTLNVKDLMINGPVAVGKKGCLSATGDYFTFFKSYPGHAKHAGAKHYNAWRDAVGQGLKDSLKKYTDGVTIPAAPIYPAFAAFPGPVAPPIPNVPWPLIACPSTGLKEIIDPQALKKSMLSKLKGSIKDKSADKMHETVMEAIANTTSLGFLIWVSTQQINLVMGMGNIPTFAPPLVPVGPVLNGKSLPMPGGHLMP